MTREEELARLILEQERDDNYFQRPERHVVLSLDAPAGFSEGGDLGVIGDLIGADEDGQIVSFLPRSRGWAMGRFIPHGTKGGYVNHGCKCAPCTAAAAAYQRTYYQRKLKRPVLSKSCAYCEEPFETSKSVAAYCSRRCRKNSWYARRGGANRKAKRQAIRAAKAAA